MTRAYRRAFKHAVWYVRENPDSVSPARALMTIRIREPGAKGATLKELSPVVGLRLPRHRAQVTS